MIAYVRHVSTGVELTFAGAWDEIRQAVELTKVIVPPAFRSYVKADRTWFVSSQYSRGLLEMFEQEGWEVKDQDAQERKQEEANRQWANQQQRQQGSQVPQRVPPLTEHFEALFRAARPELREPLRKALMMVIHPDRAGGDGQLMTALNVAWERVK